MDKLRKRLKTLGVPHEWDEKNNTVEFFGWTISKLGKDYLGYRPTDAMPSFQGSLYAVAALAHPPSTPTPCGYCHRPALLHCGGCHQYLCDKHKVCGCETEEEVVQSCEVE